MLHSNALSGHEAVTFINCIVAVFKDEFTVDDTQILKHWKKYLGEGS